MDRISTRHPSPASSDELGTSRDAATYRAQDDAAIDAPGNLSAATSHPTPNHPEADGAPQDAVPANRGRHARPATPEQDGQQKRRAKKPRHDAQAAAAKRKSRYIPALDGLRAFAVLSVIAYHMSLGWAPGGLMGVTVFFVISGYLINGLLVAEHDNTGTINLKNFWLRRVRRLFPAIALAVIGTVALCTLFNHTLLDKLRPDILPSLFFYNNWWQIFRDVSYFEAAGAPSPLTHFWSLSIEEQFYVIWPLLLLLMYKLGFKKRTMIIVVVCLAVFSGVDMAVLYNPREDPSRIYYGTDCRAVSLLIGVFLAFIWPSSAFGERAEIGRRNKGVWVVFNILGILAFAGLLLIVMFTTGFSSFPYYGGIVLTSLLSGALIAVLAVPKTWLSRLFALRPLVWIGKRSYGMYLWHLPILLLTTNQNAASATPWWMHLVQLALIFIVSALSYTFVENPIRTGELTRWWHERKQQGLRLQVPITSACFVVLIVIACVGIFVVRPTDYAEQLANGGQTASQQEEADGEDSIPIAVEEVRKTGNEKFDEIFLEPHYGEDGQQLYEPLLIGDSVSAGAIDAFYEVFPYGHIDALVNRNIWESTFPEYYEAGQVGKYVIFCLGTNNAVVDWQIDLDLLGPVPEDLKLFMVNTRSNTDFMASTNAEIERAPERHPNITVVDWYGASEGHEEYFAGDGTHLTEEGARAYMATIKDAVIAYLDSQD